MNGKQTIGLVLVVLGVGLAATFGSRLAPPEAEVVAMEGRSSLGGGEAAEPAAVASPGERLSSWFGVAGLPFLGGLLLVLAGATLSRVEARRAVQEQPSGGAGGAIDFGEALRSLRDDVHALSEVFAAGLPADDDKDSAQGRLEALQREQIARLVEAGPRVQLRYGLDHHARIFGPMAGAERKLNRAWSALVDRHVPEASASVAAAAAALDGACEALDAAQRNQSA